MLTGADGFKVSVDGSIICEEVLVQNSDNWPDYVFHKDYPLMSMGSLRSFLQDKAHLPGIPSAAEVASEGVYLGDMQKRLLEKVEELTLYILELETRIAEIENK
jgi:hypothetical protein